MKKRIISMLLVVATLVLTLAGCAYRYEKDDMSKYVDFNSEAFKKALSELVVADSTDFTYSEKTRQEKVTDAIVKALVSQAGTVQTKKGVVGKNDTLAYCYYVTGKYVDDKGDKDASNDETIEFVGAASSMKQSAAVKIQFGLSTNKDLAAAIEKAILAVEGGYDLEKKAYTTATSTSTAVKADDKVYVTYTVTTAEGVETTYSYKEMVAKAPSGATTGEGENATKAPTSIEEYIVGMKIGTQSEGTKKFSEDEKADTYSKVTVNWVVTQGEEIAIDSYKPESTTEVDVVGSKNKVDLSKATELVYHVYPVYRVDVIELDSDKYTATLILEELIGSAMTAGVVEVKDADGNVTTEGVDGTLDIFTDNGFKHSDGTLMNAIVTKLVELIAAEDEAEEKYEDAKTEYTDAKNAYDKNKTNENKAAMDAAKTAQDTAKTEFDKAAKDVDDQIKKLLECKKGDAKIEDVIKADYRKYQYETLEKKYESNITASIAKAIYKAAMAEGVITFKSLPKRAVKDAYERIMNSYEYSFYEEKYSNSGSSSSSTTTQTYTNYEWYTEVVKTGFNGYLRDALELKATATDEEVDAAINAEVEKAVKDTILVYVLAEECGKMANKDFSVTKEEKKEFKNSFNYMLLQYYSGANNVDESDYMPALLLNKVMDYLTEVDEDAVYDANNADDKRIVYKNLKYTFEEKK